MAEWLDALGLQMWGQLLTATCNIFKELLLLAHCRINPPRSQAIWCLKDSKNLLQLLAIKLGWVAPLIGPGCPFGHGVDGFLEFSCKVFERFHAIGLLQLFQGCRRWSGLNPHTGYHAAAQVGWIQVALHDPIIFSSPHQGHDKRVCTPLSHPPVTQQQDPGIGRDGCAIQDAAHRSPPGSTYWTSTIQIQIFFHGLCRNLNSTIPKLQKFEVGILEGHARFLSLLPLPELHPHTAGPIPAPEALHHAARGQ